MVITKKELQEYNKSDKKLSLVEFVEKQRNIIDVEVVDTKKKSERDEVMDMLDSMGIEYKKNAKTSDLKQLLEESN